jgi:diguanylate cyclase (GGDEF)-like protein
LADAGYMAQQLRLEAQRPGWLLMLGIDGFERLVREAGIAESDRLLAKVAQLLCLQLDGDELVCRYAGDRFVLLLPGCSASDGAERGERLRQTLSCFVQAERLGQRWPLAVRCSGGPLAAAEEPEKLMLRLARGLQ